MSELENELIERASRAVEQARSKGAEVAEAVASRSKHLSASVRMGEPEHLEEAGSRGLGLRVMSGKKTGLVHTSDLSDEGIALLVDDALELMRLGEDDPYAGPADPELVGDGSNYLDLDLYDSKIDSIDGEAAFKAALAGEEAARSVDPRIENSDGATFTRVSGARALVLSDGRAFSSLGSFASLVVRPSRSTRGISAGADFIIRLRDTSAISKRPKPLVGKPPEGRSPTLAPKRSLQASFRSSSIRTSRVP